MLSRKMSQIWTELRSGYRECIWIRLVQRNNVNVYRNHYAVSSEWGWAAHPDWGISTSCPFLAKIILTDYGRENNNRK